jgi:hypothetical protein
MTALTSHFQIENALGVSIVYHHARLVVGGSIIHTKTRATIEDLYNVEAKAGRVDREVVEMPLAGMAVQELSG